MGADGIYWHMVLNDLMGTFKDLGMLADSGCNTT